MKSPHISDADVCSVPPSSDQRDSGPGRVLPFAESDSHSPPHVDATAVVVERQQDHAPTTRQTTGQYMSEPSLDELQELDESRAIAGRHVAERGGRRRPL